jgi:DNA invertase Pin-like site-specific DNA recombinase
MVAQCREKAERLGYAVERVIVEAGKRDELDCPGLLEAIDAATAREYDVLISYDMYRFSGELMKHLYVKEKFAATAVEIVYVLGEYPDTPEGELMEHLQASVGRYERVKTRLRTMNGITGKLKKAQPVCNGVAPYGLRKVYDANKKPIGFEPTAELETLNRIVRRLAEPDGTLRVVCAELNADGVPTPRGTARWESTTILSLLKNKTYTGTYRWGMTRRWTGRREDGSRVYHAETRDESDVLTFEIPSVLDVDALEAARAAMAKRKRVRRPRRAAEDDPFTLRGMLTCGGCGGGLSTSNNNGFRRYTCLRAHGRYRDREHPCPLPQVPADAIELYAWDRVLARLSSDGFLDELDALVAGDAATIRYREQVESGRATVAKLTRRVTNAVDVLVDGEPGSVAVDHAREIKLHAERELKAATASLRALEQNAPRTFTDADVERIVERRAKILAGAMERGVMPRGRREMFQLLRMEASVSVGAGSATSVRLGRKHDFEIGWSSRIAVSNSGNDPHGYFLLLDSRLGADSLSITALAA